LNKDIGFVSEGQRSEIKIDAFPFTKYGTIDGKVVSLSNDAISDEVRGLIYAKRISMDKKDISVNDKTDNLSAGMTVAVEMKMGKRKLIEYFLSPLLNYRSESVRER
jgi:hemolysin D